MKKIILLFVMILFVLAGCVQTINEEIASKSTENSNPEKEDATSPVETMIVYTKEPTKEPTATPEPTAISSPTPIYEPSEEDLAFKAQVISEGKIITTDFTEWELIDIMCNKLGLDEYIFRLVESEDEQGLYYLVWTRDVPEAAQYTLYILDSKTGDIFYEEEATHVVANIYTSEDKEEPFRFPSDDKMVEIFIEKIFNGELPEGTIVTFEITQGGDRYFEHKRITEDGVEYICDYWIGYNWDISDTKGNVYGKLFD